MNLLSVLRARDGFWDALILATAAAFLLLNVLGLLYGITVVIPHLLYIPVVIAAYRYPRWGLVTAGSIGGVYFLMVFILLGIIGDAADVNVGLEPLSWFLLGIAFLLAAIFFRIGWAVSWYLKMSK